MGVASGFREGVGMLENLLVFVGCCVSRKILIENKKNAVVRNDMVL
jgi:hypothetical protein